MGLLSINIPGGDVGLALAMMALLGVALVLPVAVVATVQWVWGRVWG